MGLFLLTNTNLSPSTRQSEPTKPPRSLRVLYHVAPIAVLTLEIIFLLSHRTSHVIGRVYCISTPIENRDTIER